MPTPSKKGFAQVFDQSALIQQHREQQQQLAGQEIKYTEEFVDTQQKLRGMIQQAYAESPDGVNELALGAFTGYADKWFQGAVEEAMAGPITQAVPAQLAANLAKAKQAGNGAVKQGMEIIKAAGDEFQTDKLTQFIIGRLNENFERGDIYGALDEMSSMKVMDRTGSSVVLDELQIGKNFVEKMGEFQHGTYSAAAVSRTTASNIYNFQAGIPTDIKRDPLTNMVDDSLMAAAANDAQMSRIMEDEVYHQAFLKVYGKDRTQREWEDYREMMLEGTRDEKLDAEVTRMNETGEAQWWRSEALAQTAMLAADRQYTITPRESFNGGPGGTPDGTTTETVRIKTVADAIADNNNLVGDFAKYLKPDGTPTFDAGSIEAITVSIPRGKQGRSLNNVSAVDKDGSLVNMNAKEAIYDPYSGKFKLKGSISVGLTPDESATLEQIKGWLSQGQALNASQKATYDELTAKVKITASEEWHEAIDQDQFAQDFLYLSPDYSEAAVPDKFKIWERAKDGTLYQRDGNKKSASDRARWFMEQQGGGFRPKDFKPNQSTLNTDVL